MRFIPPLVHGIADYLTAATLLGLPRLQGWSKRSTSITTIAGVIILVMSLLTRYPLGMVKLLPFRMHLWLDALLNPALFGIQFQLTEEDSDVRGVLAGLGLGGTLITLLTRRK